jgi:hypothetical protein
MITRLRSGRDPFWDDGQGARRSRTRRTAIGSLAFAVSVIACGLTLAAWVRLVLPLFGTTPLG